MYSLYRTARGLRRWPSLRGTSAWRRRLSKDYTLRSTMVLHGAVSRAPRSRRWSRPRRLWRQPLLSQISSTRGPAWGGLRVDVPRGPKRSRGANCLYQEVPSRGTATVFVQGSFGSTARCRRILVAGGVGLRPARRGLAARRECGCFDCIEAWPGSSKRASGVRCPTTLIPNDGTIETMARCQLDRGRCRGSWACGRDIASHLRARRFARQRPATNHGLTAKRQGILPRGLSLCQGSPPRTSRRSRESGK